MPKYTCKYEYTRSYNQPHHVWSVVGAYGALHLHIEDLGEEHEQQYGKRYSGGLEVHRRQPDTNRAPDHENCWLLHAPCWHDGSSLAAEREWIPMWLDAPVDDHERIFAALMQAADETFQSERL